MTNIKNIPHFSLIAISVIYSAYVVSHYLTTQIEHFYAIPISIFLALLSHYYLTTGADEVQKKKNITAPFVVGLILTASIFFCEYRGVSEVAKKRMVDTSSVENLKKQLDNFRTQLGEVATARDWRSVEAKRTISENIKQLEKRLEEEKTAVEIQEIKASETASEFRFFSVILIVISVLASSCIERDSKKAKHKEKQRLQRNLRENPNTLQGTCKEEYNDISLLDRHERIRLAKEYIKSTNILDVRTIAKLFSLKISDVAKAKKEALEIQAIGF